MKQEILVKMNGMHKRFPGVHALNDVEFELKSGEVHALMGENGAGKSTLIKILAGVYDYSEGFYSFEGEEVKFRTPHEAIQKGISVIYQELNLMPQLSIAENIFFSHFPKNRIGKVNWKSVFAKTEELLKYVGLNENPKTPVGFLSVAGQQLVEIAKALSTNAKVIVMDEPTSALCPNEITNLFRIINDLREKGIGIVYISHKLDEIFEISDRITVLRDGTYIGTDKTGNFDENRLVSMMVGRELTDMYPKQESDPGETVLEVKDLSTLHVYGISFDVKAGEIIGFSGLMGAGRTELARAIIGADKRLSGQIIVNGKPIEPNSTSKAQLSGVGYVPEDRKYHGIFTNYTVRENMTISAIRQYRDRIRINRRKEIQGVNQMVDKLSIKTPSINQMIAKLSGGNQQKVILARYLMKEDLKVLIIDEPTRGIDVGAKAEIYKIMDSLAQQGLAVIMMSSEMPEVLSMCDRVFVMKKGRITSEAARGEITQEMLLQCAI